MSTLINGPDPTHDLPTRVCVFGDSAAPILRKIEAMLNAEGIVWVPGVETADVVSVHIGKVA